MIPRRTFLAGMAAAGAATLAAEAPQAGKIPRIGLLETSAADPGRLAWWAALRQQLRDLGYIEGQNIIFEARFAGEHVERLPALATDLVKVPVDVIVTGGAAAAYAAKKATSSIPIVMATGSDHVGMGIVAGLARPGGNVTGVTSLTRELSGKRLALLKEAIPKLSRVAIVWPEDNEVSKFVIRDTEAAAAVLGVRLRAFGIRNLSRLENAFTEMVRERTEALVIVASPTYFAERRQLADLAVKYHLPSMAGGKEYADAGALLSYAPKYPELFRRAAIYVDKILKGSNPADLPIEQPTEFELIINLKTAKALGLTIPRSLLLRADQIIE